VKHFGGTCLSEKMGVFDWWRSKGPRKGGTWRGVYIYMMSDSQREGLWDPASLYLVMLFSRWPGRILIVRVLGRARQPEQALLRPSDYGYPVKLDHASYLLVAPLLWHPTKVLRQTEVRCHRVQWQGHARKQKGRARSARKAVDGRACEARRLITMPAVLMFGDLRRTCSLGSNESE
jgi:hypothetical protein